MKNVRLKNSNFEAIIDDDDYEAVAAHDWLLTKVGYVARFKTENGKRKCIYLHKFISNFEIVDHANGNKLDNRRDNLRQANKQLNAANIKGRARSGFKGVTFHPQGGKWRARIMVNGKQVHIGMFETPEMANFAYAKAAAKFFGEFANTSHRQNVEPTR